LRARDLLFAERDDYAAAYAKFRWPALDRFNWALDWFDPYARGTRRSPSTSPTTKEAR